MALPFVLGWIGITVGVLLLLALVDVGRAVARRITRLRFRHVSKPAVHSEAGSSPSRAR